MDLFAVERQKYICDTLERDGSAAINDLAAALDVSAETIRRDLLALEEREGFREYTAELLEK